MSTLLQQDSPVQNGLNNRYPPVEIFRFNTRQDNVHVARKWCRSTFGDGHGWGLTYTNMGTLPSPISNIGTLPEPSPTMVVIVIYDNHPWELDKIKVMLALRW